jgi:hypothetical protein
MAVRPDTKEYQAQLVALRALTYRDTQTVWSLLDMDRLDESFPKYAAAAVALVRLRRAITVSLARDYWKNLRRASGITGEMPVVPSVELPTLALISSLRIVGPVSIKTAMTHNVRIEKASRDALVRTMGVIDRHINNGGRDWLMAATEADPEATGWKRRTLGTCGYCQDLEGSGGAFHAHDHCGCVPEPQFKLGAARAFKPVDPSQIGWRFSGMPGSVGSEIAKNAPAFDQNAYRAVEDFYSFGKKMSPEAIQEASLLYYGGNGYRTLNPARRGQNTDMYGFSEADNAARRERLGIIEQGLRDTFARDSFELQQDAVFFRGSFIDEEDFELGFISDPAWVSMSLSRTVAAGFADEPDTWHMTVKVPKGTPLLAVGAQEQEVLLDGAAFWIEAWDEEARTVTLILQGTHGGEV